MSKPTKAQAVVLQRLAAGETIRLGTRGWPYLKRDEDHLGDAIRMMTFFILRRNLWIEETPGAGLQRPFRITTAGRATLTAPTPADGAGGPEHVE